MNVYLIQEDGDSFCIRAKTMAEAVLVCESSYLDDRKEDEGEHNFNENIERDYYHEQLLQSCQLVGELKN